MNRKGKGNGKDKGDRKSVPCAFFAKGACTKENCPFLHQKRKSKGRLKGAPAEGEDAGVCAENPALPVEDQGFVAFARVKQVIARPCARCRKPLLSEQIGRLGAPGTNRAIQTGCL